MKMINNDSISNSTNNTNDPLNFKIDGHPVEIVVLCLIDVLILLGNSLVILAFVKGTRSLRTKTNCFVISLAVSDLMVGILSLPIWIATRLGFYTGEISEHLLTFDVFFGATSILCLSAISFERMLAVKYPAFHHNLKDKPVYIAIASTWLSGLFISVIRYGFEGGFVIDKNNSDPVKQYTLFVLVVAFILPLLIILVCYAIIFYAVRNMIMASNREDNLSRDIQVAKTISVIIGLFVFCWLPFFVLNMVFFYGTTSQSFFIFESQWLVTLTKILHYSNSMMNFFVYAVRSVDFRKAFKRLLHCDCSQELRVRIQSFTKGSLKVPESIRILKSSTNSTTTSSSYLPNSSTNYRMKANTKTSLLSDKRLDDNDNVFE